MADEIIPGQQCRVKDETGKLFGFLLVISRHGKDRNGSATWLCECTYKGCGNKRINAGTVLRAGVVLSCGCYNRELVTSAHITHGLSHHPLYEFHKSALHRCNDPRNYSYPSHGGRGIKVCERWHDVGNFISDMQAKWDTLQQDGTQWTLERIDVNGDYCPDNCKFASHKEQQNNKTNNHLIEYDGQIKTAAQWGDEYGLSGPAIIGRLRIGWDVEKALTFPIRKQRPRAPKQ